MRQERFDLPQARCGDGHKIGVPVRLASARAVLETEIAVR
jgi:hypothetical protein